MENKGLWGKLAYWQKGATIGLIFGILVIFLILQNYQNTYFYYNLSLVYLLVSAIVENQKLISLVGLAFWYVLIGSIVGFILQFCYSKKALKRFGIIFAILFLVVVIALQTVFIFYSGYGYA